jgi:hypothetical protein
MNFFAEYYHDRRSLLARLTNDYSSCGECVRTDLFCTLSNYLFEGIWGVLGIKSKALIRNLSRQSL